MLILMRYLMQRVSSIVETNKYAETMIKPM